MNINDLDIPEVHETSIDGLYVRDVPLATLKQMDAITNIYEKADFIFEHVACTEDGGAMDVPADLEGDTGTLRLKAIIRAVMQVFLAGKALTGDAVE